jgi:hypothetical protein
VTPQPPPRPAPSNDPGPESDSSDSSDPTLSQRIEDYWRSRKEEGELQTTEIPISMLMALDKLMKSSAEAPRADEPIPAPPSPRHAGPAGGGLGGHLQRVAAYAKLLALKLGMPEKEANFVKQIAPMHDIGKWAIPESILQKPSSLTPEEWEIMKTHAEAGYDMLKDSKLDVLQMGALVAVQHQEKFDGTGYPKGLKGEEIHIYSRITTVADVFDALGSERSYKQAWAVSDIARYFADGRGTHFDPRLVDLLLGHLEEFLAIRDGLGSV